MRQLAGNAARALPYLVTAPFTGAVAAAWVLVATLCVLLVSITQLGGPAFLGAAWVTRRLATVERRRAGWVLGAAIESPYLSATGSLGQRVAGVARQPATWRDLAWLAVLFPIGLVSGVVGIVLTGVGVGAVTAPLWAWAVPNPHAPFPMNFLMTTGPGRVCLTVVGLVLLPLAIRLVVGIARVQAAAARALLAPGAHVRLVAETARLSRSRSRVVDAQAAELRRIERDLHDGAQARIVAAGMTLALAARKLGTEDSARPDVESARGQLNEALTELRRLVRGIHPPILTDRGLHAALTALAADSPLRVELRGDPEMRYPAALESAAYFVVAEGLANAGKHANATRCLVELTRTSTSVRVALTDDGDGGADPAGAGLDGLRRRVEALDGELRIGSPAGGPTTLEAEFPCES